MQGWHQPTQSPQTLGMINICLPGQPAWSRPTLAWPLHTPAGRIGIPPRLFSCESSDTGRPPNHPSPGPMDAQTPAGEHPPPFRVTWGSWPPSRGGRAWTPTHWPGDLTPLLDPSQVSMGGPWLGPRSSWQGLTAPDQDSRPRTGGMPVQPGGGRVPAEEHPDGGI